MLRRLIAISLIAVSCLAVFLPLALALQPAPVMACCRRNAHHHCQCCAGKKPGSGGPEFRDGSSSCPCSSQIPTRSVRGDLPLQGAFTAQSPAPGILSPARSSLCRSIDRIQQSNRGPPIVLR